MEVHKSLISLDLKCFELQVPETLESDGFLELEATYPDRDAIKQTKPIRINKDFAITLIETDKAVYKPDQSVKIRILTINNNLEPLYEKVSLVDLSSLELTLKTRLERARTLLKASRRQKERQCQG